MVEEVLWFHAAMHGTWRVRFMVSQQVANYTSIKMVIRFTKKVPFHDANFELHAYAEASQIQSSRSMRLKILHTNDLFS